MKQIISLFLFIFLTSSAAFTQIIATDSLTTSKKSWLIGGGFSIGTTDNNFQGAGNTTVISFSPTAGYFVTNKLLVGTHISFDLFSTSNSSRKHFSIAPFLQYFFGKRKLQPFLQLNGNYNKFNFEDKISGNKSNFNQTGLFGELGINYFLSKNVALKTSLIARLAGEEQNLPINDFNTTLNLSINNQIGIGFGIDYYIRGKTFLTSLREFNPLENRYLVAGNRSIGLNGIILFDPFVLLTSIYWKKFKTAKTRLNFIVEIFIVDDFDGAFLFRPEIEHFFKIKEHLYFSPSIGINSLFSNIGSTELYVNGQIFPKLTYFFNNSFMELGFQINTPYTQFSGDTDFEWEGSFTIAGELFVQNNLSLRGELWIDAFGEEHYGNNLLFDALPDVIFRIGVNYFLGVK